MPCRRRLLRDMWAGLQNDPMHECGEHVGALQESRQPPVLHAGHQLHCHLASPAGPGLQDGSHNALLWYKDRREAKVVADQSYIEIEYPPRRQSTTTFVCLIIQVRGGVVV